MDRDKTVAIVVGFLFSAGLFAQTPNVQPVMTNSTVEAMVRGGVPSTTVIQSIKTATEVDFKIDNPAYVQLTKAGASDSVSDQILEAMHQRVMHGVASSTPSRGYKIYNQDQRKHDIDPSIDTQLPVPTPVTPAHVQVPTPTSGVSVPVPISSVPVASTTLPPSTPTPVIPVPVPASAPQPIAPTVPQVLPAFTPNPNPGGANAKTYKHASVYQVAILDQNLRVATGTDVTLAKTTTDAKLGGGGQGIHLLHTVAGDYRVEAPVNKGLSIISALGSNAYHPAQTFHNKWFMDNVQPGTKVLFASGCTNPSKKHPNETVRCTFWEGVPAIVEG